MSPDFGEAKLPDSVTMTNIRDRDPVCRRLLAATLIWRRSRNGSLQTLKSQLIRVK